MARIKFELVTPETLVTSREVELVVVPGVEGDIGVLMGHSRTMTLLRTGFVCVFEGDKVIECYLVDDGFAEIRDDYCVVLAEQATLEADIDRTAFETRLRELDDELRLARDPLDVERFDLQKQMIQAQIFVSRELPYRS